MTTAQRLVVLAATGLSLAAAAVMAGGTIAQIVASGDALGPGLAMLLTVPWIAGVALVGLVLALRRPNNRVGWLFVALGPLLGFTVITASYRLAVPRGYEYGFEWLATVSTWVVFMLAGPGLALAFPDGRLPSPRWRRPVGAVAVTFLVSLVLYASLPGKLTEIGTQDRAMVVDPSIGLAALEPFGDLLNLGMLGGAFALCALGVGAIVYRRRTGDAVVRAQLAWFLLAISLIPVGMTVSLVEYLVSSDGGAKVGPILLYAGFGLTPVAVAIAILRYRLFDIDVVIRRTLTYGVVVAVLAATYIASVVALQTVVANVVGGQALAVAASTLLVAAAFHPVRSRVQHTVDRRFNRARYDAELAVVAFGGRLRGQLDLDGVAAALTATAADTIEPRSLSVWLRPR